MTTFEVLQNPKKAYMHGILTALIKVSRIKDKMKGQDVFCQHKFTTIGDFNVVSFIFRSFYLQTEPLNTYDIKSRQQLHTHIAAGPWFDPLREAGKIQNL